MIFMTKTDPPLYVVGMPEDVFFAELIISKFSSAVKRLEKKFRKIDEARITIKRTRAKGKMKNYVVTVLIKTPNKRFNYKKTGWDLSSICENLSQKLLSNLSKYRKNRSRRSVRKIEDKIF